MAFDLSTVNLFILSYTKVGFKYCLHGYKCTYLIIGCIVGCVANHVAVYSASSTYCVPYITAFRIECFLGN